MSADNTDLSVGSAPVNAEGATPVLAEPETISFSTPQVEVPTPESLAAEATPVVPDPPRDEIERIDPDLTGPITLMSGTVVDVVPLKLRETMKLLKIVTRGAGSILEGLISELDMENPEGFAQTLGALILMSIPEAEDEAVDFIQAMVLPQGLDALPTREAKVDALQKLGAELFNPELDDVVTIVERVVRRESEDIRSLGKRMATAFKLAPKVGILPAQS